MTNKQAKEVNVVMAKEVKHWRVKYDHKDGRSGEIDAVTEVAESGAFKYGNGKSGALTVGEWTNGYDLRYCNEDDLHRVMLDDYFGKGLVEATEV